MTRSIRLNFVIIGLAVGVAASQGFAETPHRINSIRPGSGGTMLLGLTGSVSQSFSPYFDLYLLEASTNLQHWMPLPPLLRTNALPAALAFRDEAATLYPARF